MTNSANLQRQMVQHLKAKVVPCFKFWVLHREKAFSMLCKQLKHCNLHYPGTDTLEHHFLLPWAESTLNSSTFKIRSSALSPGCCVLNMLVSHSFPFTPFIYQSRAKKVIWGEKKMFQILKKACMIFILLKTGSS